MFRKMFCTLLIGFTLTNVNTPYRFHIFASDDQEIGIKACYEYKNELIHSYQEMILGMDEEEVMNDLTRLYQGEKVGHDVYFKLGDGKGEELSGEFKNNCCDNEIKPKSWIRELFE